MRRREFLTDLALALIGGAAAWAWGRLSWPEPGLAAPSELRLALLADAHLRDGNPARPEARALARAVAEIRRLGPAPDLVLFAGDLAHDGNPNALALGKEILADLPAPLAAVMGEGDAAGKGAGAWPRLLGETRFSRVFSVNPDKKCPLKTGERGGNLNLNLLPKTENRKPKTVIQVLGLHTSLSASAGGPVFEIGGAQRGWLARELARLDPGRPLLILSHAPLAQIFRPWRQWTRDAPEVMALLSRFSRVYCFHGHVHAVEVGGRLIDYRPGLAGSDNSLQTENRKPKTENHPLPATAWPLPSPLQGTPPTPRPGLGSRGCGWGLASLGNHSLQYQPQIWQA